MKKLVYFHGITELVVLTKKELHFIFIRLRASSLLSDLKKTKKGKKKLSCLRTSLADWHILSYILSDPLRHRAVNVSW